MPDRESQMGQIVITVEGSFKPFRRQTFSAMDSGHAEAVASAIEWLAGSVLLMAIELDHELHEDGKRPRVGFGKRT